MLRVWLSALVLVLCCAPAASAATPRLLDETSGKALYKPSRFTASGHHPITGAHWSAWGAKRATARATIHSQFAASQPSKRRATITLTTPKRMCGVYTFTKVLADGDLV